MPEQERLQHQLRWMWIPIAVVAVSIAVIGSLTEDLLLGWFNFPRSVLPRVTVDWPSLVAGGVAFFGFAICVHFTGSWVATWLPKGVLKSPIWPLRQTGYIVAGVTLMFAIGTAMVGATHQVIWLSVDRTPPSLSGDIEPPLLLPIAAAQRATRESEASSWVRILGMGVINYEETFKHLPAGRSESLTGEPLHGWPIFVGPFILLSKENIDFNKPWNHEPNAIQFRCQLREFVNPSMPGRLFDDEGYGLNHFAANVHVFPTYRHRNEVQAGSEFPGMKLAEIKDGASNTLLVGTARGHFKPWGSPDGVRDPALGINTSPDGFGDAPGSLGAHFIMADGSMRFVSSKIDPAVLKALATPNGGERLPDSPP